MRYKIEKQFISTGQPGDPAWAERRIYVERITSGSYSSSIDEYDDFQLALERTDELKLEQYTGWGVEGDGREYLIFDEVEDKDKSLKEKIDKGEKIKDDKKIKPEIYGFSPATAYPGSTVRISGSFFYGVIYIDFAKNISTKNLRVWNSNIIDVVVPTGSETGVIEVFNYDGKSEKIKDNITIIDGKGKGKIKTKP